MTHFQNKLVAIMNRSTPPGVLMNALAHMTVGFGASIGRELLRLTNYKDKDGHDHPNISEIPFIILEANSNKIRGVREQAKEGGIQFVDFTHTMTEGSFEEQLARSLETHEKDLIYYGIVLFGEWEKVSAMTRKFSLWK